MSERLEATSTLRKRAGHMMLAVTIGVSVAGFLMGVRERPEPPEAGYTSSVPESRPIALAPEAVDYLKMSGVRRGPNANWKQDLPVYQDDPTQFYGDQSPTDVQRDLAVSARRERRAYSGAPPVVPHAIDERNAQACLSCHGSGFKVEQVVAPRMSHHYLPNCTQCHVEATQDAPWAASAISASPSTFVGMAEPGRGDRLGPGAPPTIPHALWMRSDCASCHGSLSKDGLRSSHPWRTNCTQCHAPSRGFDWMPLELPPPTPRDQQEANSTLVENPSP